MPDQHPDFDNPWRKLRQFTNARIALNRAGSSQTTEDHLQFQLAHAMARDAVTIPLDFASLTRQLANFNQPLLTLSSQAEDRRLYLQRPDLGRRLDKNSQAQLQTFCGQPYDAAIVVADGLSSKAVSAHAAALLDGLLPVLLSKTYRLAPLCLVKHGRVAIGDDIAKAFAARFCIVLIGERPGLSSPDSLGIYFTYQAQPGITSDAGRNCISNIHGNGLSYAQAVNKLSFLLEESDRLKLSGVDLKDNTRDETSLDHTTRQNPVFLLE